MKKLAKIAAICGTIPIIFFLLLLIGIVGSGTSAIIPADEELAGKYQAIGHELGVDWTWIMLIDMYKCMESGELELESQNPVSTALNCIKLRVDLYEHEEHEDEGGGWAYRETVYYSGLAEISGYLELSRDTGDLSVVLKAIHDKQRREERISIEAFDNIDEVLQRYYDFNEDIRNEIWKFIESEYLIALYGNPYGEYLGGAWGDYEVGDLQYPQIGMQIPLYYQYQEPWRSVKFGGGTVSSSGCSVTSMAMVFSYLRGKTITPPDLISWTGNRYYVHPAGQSWAIFPDTANQWNIQCVNLGNSITAAMAALADGKPVIARCGRGTFTRQGHFIVLRGITEDGQILVNDPNDNGTKGFFNKSFSPALFQREATNYWCFDY